MKIIKKKAIIAFAMSMIFSLATLQGISQKNAQQQNVNLQRLGAACAYAAEKTEAGTSAVYSYASDAFGSAFAGMVVVGLGSIYISATNPVGWTYWLATGLVGL